MKYILFQLIKTIFFFNPRYRQKDRI